MISDRMFNLKDIWYERKSINYRDVFLNDTCNDGLAKLLEWEIELEKKSLKKKKRLL